MNSNIISSIMFALIVLIALKPSITIADVLVYTQGTNQVSVKDTRTQAKG